MLSNNDLKIQEIINEKETKTEDKDNIRPQSLSSYIGQEKIKKIVSVSIKAAKERNEALAHMLFYGPPGLGKTTIACIIANEMEKKIKITTGPVIEKPGDLVAILLALEDGDILFIDEIHRLNKQVEEILYPAMEDFAVDIITGDGANKKAIRIDLPHFTLIGATTRTGMLSAPLRDRFGTINRMEFYSIAELTQVVIRSAKILGIEITQEAAEGIARRSRGTPRLANRLLKQIRDFAQVQYNSVVDENVVDNVLDILGIDTDGFDDNDNRYIKALLDIGDGAPVGISTVSAAISEDEGTIIDVYEPFLLQQGFINKTPRGRILTDKGIEHIKKNSKEK